MIDQDTSRDATPDLRPRRRSVRPQVSLATILLATAVVAVWIAYGNALRETRRLQARVIGLRRIAGELRVEDPSQLAIVQRFPTKYGELIWDVHVPDVNPAGSPMGFRTQLCLAMDGIPPWLQRMELPPPLKTILLSPGRHAIELTYEQVEEVAELVVLVDGELQMEVTRPKDWESGKGWSSTSVHDFTQSESFALERPLVLLNRRFRRDDGGGRSSTPDEPSEGILLWVRRAEAMP